MTAPREVHTRAPRVGGDRAQRRGGDPTQPRGGDSGQPRGGGSGQPRGGGPAQPGGGATRVDGRRARGDSTRRAILGRAMQIASVEGLDGVSLAELAADLEMSKSGLFAHFGSKEALQLSTLRAARRVFSDLAVTPAQEVPSGIRRLDALLSAWFKYIGADAFAGGCLLMHAAAEFDARPGPVRDLVSETMGLWMDLLVEQVRAGVERGELAEGTDARQLAWELHALGLALNWDRQLNGAADAESRARTALATRLQAAATKKGRRKLAPAT